MRTTALAAALLLAAAPLSAQVIRGTLVDAATQAPVAGASVRLVSARGEETALARTDSAGAFTVWARYAGAFRLRAERLGYTPSLSPEVRLAGRDSVRVLFRISASAVVMEPLQVVSHVRRRSPRLAGFLRRAEMDRGGWFATREDIEAATPVRVSDVLRSARGIHLRMVYQGVGYQVRGRGECLPAVFLDGFSAGA
jgi:hypothetical protein